ncbi:pyocin knob domain-containing protein [Glutamicibacter sp. FBE19]|uniref:pyocin knob domain-containing protein n=1 Tax=Glutamicibacter sp. FBE19 TaxID=2761534 RepID=UPI00189696F7|nr:pyocin knob domain-containing protein [Glutamicibacter sp. FBE19]MBF6672452.1 hypothetical protein [Glutamicibacter sp. FBE19]
MTYSYTSPDNIPYPLPGSKIADTTSSENLTKLLEQQATSTQSAITGRDNASIRIRGTADVANLDNYVGQAYFGLYTIGSGNGMPPLPIGALSRLELIVHGTDLYDTTHTLTARDSNMTWQRTCLQPTAIPKVWSPWKSDTGAKPPADGRDLNTMFELIDFGVHEITYNGGATNLPPGFYGKGTLEVDGATKFTVTHTLIAREQNVVWQRQGVNTSLPEPVWSNWAIVGQPAISNTTQVVIGDSLGNLLASNVGDNMPGIGVSGRGWNGETSDGINMRIGAKRTVWKVTGGSIPASGGVAVTTDMNLDLTASASFYTGHLNGIAGRIDWNPTDGSFVFTRDTAGSVVPSSGKVLFEPRWTAQVQFMTLINTMGRNDLSLDAVGADADTVTHIQANYQELAAWAKADRKRICFLGTLNRTNEPIGHENHTRVLQLEAWLKSNQPGSYLPWRRYIIDQVIYDLGITPTARDLENMANDCPPPSVMADITHPTAAAADMTWEKLIGPWELAKGWI